MPMLRTAFVNHWAIIIDLALSISSAAAPDGEYIRWRGHLSFHETLFVAHQPSDPLHYTLLGYPA